MGTMTEAPTYVYVFTRRAPRSQRASRYEVVAGSETEARAKLAHRTSETIAEEAELAEVRNEV